MYYVSLILFFAVLILWRRDVKQAKAAVLFLKEELRQERKDLETLRGRYESLIRSGQNNDVEMEQPLYQESK